MENNDEVRNQISNEPKQEAKGFSITSMVLGIISLVLLCVWYISIPCGILAIVFSFVGKKRGGKGMAIAGLVTGIVSLAIMAVLLITGAALVGGAIGTADSLVNNYNEEINSNLFDSSNNFWNTVTNTIDNSSSYNDKDDSLFEESIDNFSSSISENFDRAQGILNDVDDFSSSVRENSSRTREMMHDIDDSGDIQ